MGYGLGARIAGLAVTSLLLAGCAGTVRDSALTESDLRADYGGAPAPLAALFAQRNELLGGGARAFERELRSLRGYPVVVDKWASWCPNCQAEFSIFQRVAPAVAHSVAFVGDDVEDHHGVSFLRKFPLSFPSYADSTDGVDQALGAASAGYTPVTYFYNRRGQQVYYHYGPYLSVASLEHDIRLYLGA